MKRILYILILVSALFIIMSFSGSDSTPESFYSNVWVYNGEDVYKNRRNFFENNGGFKFYEDGRLVVRMDLSICGNSEYSFENYKGDWKFLNDSTIQIYFKSFNYWNTKKIRFKIIDEKHIELIPLTRLKLVLKRKPRPFLDY